jgi:4-hydroxy-3-methylbut-2-enyl diphosphate reductase
VDGLIHLSQLSERRIAKAEEIVKVGEAVKARVIDVKGQDKRISLSLKDADGGQPSDQPQATEE